MSLEVSKGELLPLRSTEDIVLARQLTRAWAVRSGFSLVDQTKLVTATSELARNAVVHGGGGEMRIEMIHRNGRGALQLTFSDHGPGIADLDLAMKDGYTTANGMGLGLSGSRRLVNEFSIESKVGEGTRVTIVKWA
jgi:serine/threonine-protein kinase RsbT